MPNLPLLGLGRTAEIYEYDPGRVLKLFYDWMARRLIDRDILCSGAVGRTGLPVPRMDGAITIDGRTGIIFERVDGPTLSSVLLSHPWQLRLYTRVMADLQAAIHRCPAPAELPSQRELLRRRLGHIEEVPQPVRSAALNALDSLPDGDSLCHGDFHTDNILVAPERPVVIDWMNATRGNPMADVARTSLILSLNNAPPGRKMPFYVMPFKRLGLKFYLHRYFEIMPGAREEAREWMFPLAVERLAEEVPGEKEQLMRLIQRYMERKVNLSAL